MSQLKKISSVKSFDGSIQTYSHNSVMCNCDMTFSIYLPPQAEEKKVPVLYWLSGLTCTNENFMVKSGFQKYASELGIAVVTPDTSPRGANIKGEDDSWDFGTGAGFYVDSTQEPWNNYYKMYSYILKELPEIINSNFPIIEDKKSISGHSMGGHGALILSLNNPSEYKSVSAFAPICAPTECAWGIKAFTNYLGENKDDWKKYDATELLKVVNDKFPILIDQGDADNFLKDGQLRPDLLMNSAKENDWDINLRMQKGYDHSYYFISTFIEEHLNYHSNYLK
jgi:S-formylglutathione hydrolase